MKGSEEEEGRKEGLDPACKRGAKRVDREQARGRKRCGGDRKGRGSSEGVKKAKVTSRRGHTRSGEGRKGRQGGRE